MVKIDEHSVFLNVPFDESYEKLFIGLIAALVSLSRTPRSVLEISEDGVGRMSRLQNLISECRVSVHDLSRVGIPVRFNMPFELGLACATAQIHAGRYGYFVLERVPHRLVRTLSDMNGRDPIIHGGSQKQLINGILGQLSVRGQTIEPTVVYRVARKLMAAVNSRMQQTQQATIYSRMMFNFSVAAATRLAVEEGLIKA